MGGEFGEQQERQRRQEREDAGAEQKLPVQRSGGTGEHADTRRAGLELGGVVSGLDAIGRVRVEDHHHPPEAPPPPDEPTQPEKPPPNPPPPPKPPPNPPPRTIPIGMKMTLPPPLRR